MRVFVAVLALWVVSLGASQACAQRVRPAPRALRIAATAGAGLGTLALTAGGYGVLTDLAVRDCPAPPARCVTRQLWTLLGAGGLIMAGPGLTPFVVHRTGSLAGGRGDLWWTALGSSLGAAAGLALTLPRVGGAGGVPSSASLALVGLPSLVGAVLAYELSSRDGAAARAPAPSVRLSPDFSLGANGLVAGVSGEFP
ncbi:MAG: hypothetical protein HY909_08300 [Deltaproteobacteria bacterium]|nr:hypothetical protein [Deltaproteobacteria bacterium]